MVGIGGVFGSFIIVFMCCSTVSKLAAVWSSHNLHATPKHDPFNAARLGRFIKRILANTSHKCTRKTLTNANRS